MTDFEERLLKALERIASALDKVVDEPPPFLPAPPPDAPPPRLGDRLGVNVTEMPKRSSLLPE